MTSHNPVRAAVFPMTDQLPLGRPVVGAPLAALRSGSVLGSDGVKTGHDQDEIPSEPAVAAGSRPFGLRFAAHPTESLVLDPATLAYDEAAQIAVARDGAGWTPLIHHSMGLTLHTTGQIPREDEIHDKTT